MTKTLGIEYMIIHDADDDDDDNADTQRRDKRLREEFLRLPAPPGIGYKSSRILGLEESYLQVAMMFDDELVYIVHTFCSALVGTVQ